MDDQTVKVKVKNLATSAQKLRLVADMVRGKELNEAKDLVKFINKKSSKFVLKALKSGEANAEHNHNLDPETLYVSHISVDEAPTYKRHRYASRGRVTRILKRRSHLNLELSIKK
jgi:large subunit ribosomal protein L22